MDPFSVCFEYSRAHRIVICKSHHQGILKSQLYGHLSSHHKEFTAKTRRDIVLAAGAYPRWAEKEEDVVFPAAEARPIPHLEVFTDGLRCTAPVAEGEQCGYIRRTLQDIQKHCGEKHGWVNNRKRGRQYKGQPSRANTMWTTGVWCQKFQPAGTIGRLFPVHVVEDAIEPADEEERAVQQAIASSMHEATASIEAAEKKSRAQIEADSDRFEFNAWLNRAG